MLPCSALSLQAAQPNGLVKPPPAPLTPGQCRPSSPFRTLGSGRSLLPAPTQANKAHQSHSLILSVSLWTPGRGRLLVPTIMGAGHLHINFSTHLQLNKVANTFTWEQSSDRFFVKSSIYGTETHLNSPGSQDCHGAKY